MSQPRHWRAYLLLVDVVSFSERLPVDQAAMIRHLLVVLAEERTRHLSDCQEAYVNSTGDGFVLAAPMDGDMDLAARLVNLTEAIVGRAGEHKDGTGRALQIRGGLHVGNVLTRLDAPGAETFAVGDGLNWVARVASAAAPGQVLASEEFVDAMLKTSGYDAARERFHPPPSAEHDDGPFRVRVKHDRSASVRVTVGKNLSHAVPPAIERATRIAGHVHTALELVGQSIAAGLAGPDEPPAAALARLQPRLTIWRPRKDRLHPVPPRVELGAAGSLGQIKTDTTWALPAEGAVPAGPLAQAFVHGAPRWLLDLPLPSHAPEYEAAWAHVGVPAHVVRGFTRKPRAILALPLQLLDEPVGVVCIDLLDPLSDADDVVERILREVLLRSSYLLAALAHLEDSR